jgi:hypothetical protein
MSLVKKLKEVADALSLEFLYDQGAGLEAMVESADFSDGKVVLFAFPLSLVNFVDGKESGQFGIFFSQVGDIENTGLMNDDIQDNCKSVAFQFLKAIDTGNTLTYEAPTLRRFFDEFHFAVTGVAITANFTERVGLVDCFVKPEVPEAEPEA